MGFGSYDESEQQDQDVSTDEDEGVSIHENDFEGDVNFEGASTDELMDKLADIKSDSSSE